MKLALYLNILKATGPLSLIFEKNLLMSLDISPAVETSILNLEDLCDEGLNYMIDWHQVFHKGRGHSNNCCVQLHQNWSWEKKARKQRVHRN